MNKQTQRVQGFILTKATMANQNAGFDNYPRQTADGTIFASDNSLGYTIKQMAKAENQQLFYIKRLKLVENKKGKTKNEKKILQCLSLDETYEKLFGDIKTHSKDEVLENLGTCFDIRTFGAAFAVTGNNFSIHGPIQIYQGLNMLEDTETIVMDIIAPFRNPNNEDGTQSTMGEKIVTDKAIYNFDVTINPKNLDDFVDYGIVLTQEDVENFKRYASLSTTYYSSNSKQGCSNVMSLFVNLKEDSKKLLLPLSDFIKVKYEDETVTVDLTKLEKYLENAKDDIDNIEIFYQKDSKVEFISNNTIEYTYRYL